jgi:cob(I)alamin adenosyltransferase
VVNLCALSPRNASKSSLVSAFVLPCATITSTYLHATRHVCERA